MEVSCDLGDWRCGMSEPKDYGKPEAAEFGEIRLVIADPGHEYDGANYVCTITADRTTRVLYGLLLSLPIWALAIWWSCK